MFTCGLTVVKTEDAP